MRIVELGSRCSDECVSCAAGDVQAAEAPVDALSCAAADGEVVALVGAGADRLPAVLSVARALRDGGASRVVWLTDGRALAVDGIAARLLDAGITECDVALHGPTAAIHDWVVGSDGAFRRSAAGIRRARAAGLAVAVTFPTTRSTYRHAAEIVRVAAALGVPRVFLAARSGAATAAHPRARPLPGFSMVRPFVAAAAALGRVAGVSVVAGPFPAGWAAARADSGAPGRGRAPSGGSRIHFTPITAWSSTANDAPAGAVTR